MKKSLIWFILLVAVNTSTSANALDFSNASVNRLIQSHQAPDGVVFELISWDEKTWTWAAPMIASLRQQLEDKFPDIDVVVVSHGGEQFQLTRDKQQEQPEAIAQLQSLTEDGMSLHVCGTHSSWKDVADTAYIDFVDVSPSGPAQMNDYIKLGYQHILLQKSL